MTKKELLNFSPLEAFEHGKMCKQKGYSEEYNPYRNYDFLCNETASLLYSAWIDGWNL